MIQYLFFLLLWGVPSLQIWHSLENLDKDERVKVRREIKEPLFQFGILPMGIGLPIYLTGSVLGLDIPVVRHIGAGLIIFGWMVAGTAELTGSDRNVLKGIGMIAAGVLGTGAYLYFI
ncbi:hypothetical protein [Edaphobacillus lindanitolerans]|uniref:hypothetical protein n=1 Tax=Edaphobacillus lindanitolerans TaxID=550447 RepID=UPI001185FBDB|nr:hypothetical protein [Edaphobacillus lindanitolerans]